MEERGPTLPPFHVLLPVLPGVRGPAASGMGDLALRPDSPLLMPGALLA